MQQISFLKTFLECICSYFFSSVISNSIPLKNFFNPLVYICLCVFYNIPTSKPIWFTFIVKLQERFTIIIFFFFWGGGCYHYHAKRFPPGQKKSPDPSEKYRKSPYITYLIYFELLAREAAKARASICLQTPLKLAARYSSIYLCIYLSIYLSVFLAIYQYLSIYLSFSLSKGVGVKGMFTHPLL